MVIVIVFGVVTVFVMAIVMVVVMVVVMVIFLFVGVVNNAVCCFVIFVSLIGGYWNRCLCLIIAIKSEDSITI